MSTLDGGQCFGGTVSCIILKGRCDLYCSEYACINQGQNKFDNKEDSLYEEVQHVLDQLLNNNMKILLANLK